MYHTHMLALALALASSAFSLRLPSQPPAAAAHVALRRALAPPRTAVAAAAATSTPFEFDELGDSWSASGGSSVGVLLLSVGSPETPDDVEEYLYNVFCDPEIVTLPPLLSWLKKPLAWFVAKSRAAEARAAMAEVGGESPQVAAAAAGRRRRPLHSGASCGSRLRRCGGRQRRCSARWWRAAWTRRSSSRCATGGPTLRRPSLR